MEDTCAGGKMWLEDEACNKLAELALNDVGVAGSILREAVSCSPFAVRSVDSPDVHKAFQQVSVPLDPHQE